MADTRAIVEAWLIAEFASQLTAVFEKTTGERPVTETTAATGAPAADGSWWRQSFSGIPGDLWLFTPSKSEAAAAHLVLLAAGMQDDDADTSKSTYQETTNRALSGLAQAMSARLERETAPSSGSTPNGPTPNGLPGDLRWVQIRLKFVAATVVIHAAPSAELCAQLEGADRTALPPVTLSEQREAGDEAEPANQTADLAKSKTFGLLLDVELPVSVSFGRAQLTLNEVLKLTTGSVVELNRSIAEPVEVIVNNCVIARGEVVVVEGNFGIRIQEVISRTERLRTLN